MCAPDRAKLAPALEAPVWALEDPAEDEPALT
jgi:hypothetical protein